MHLDQAKLDAAVGRLFADLSAGYGGVMVSLGDKLGLYRAMAGAGPLSSTEVARRSGCGERYVREWLNAQVAGGYVDYHPSSATYELTAEQAAILAEDTSPVFLPHAWQVVASMWADEPKAPESAGKLRLPPTSRMTGGTSSISVPPFAVAPAQLRIHTVMRSAQAEAEASQQL